MGSHMLSVEGGTASHAQREGIAKFHGTGCRCGERLRNQGQTMPVATETVHSPSEAPKTVQCGNLSKDFKRLHCILVDIQ